MTDIGLAIALVFTICCAGAAAGLVLPERRIPLLLAWAGSLAALATLWASAAALASGSQFNAKLWAIPAIATVSVSVDRLAAFFLLIAAIVILSSSVFSGDYMRRYLGRYSLRAFNGWYLLLCAAIVWILIAADVLGFLIAWELMSISSYMLVNFEHQHKGTPQAGYLMLAMGEAGFLAVEVMLLFLALRGGSLDFAALNSAGAGLGPGTRWTVFLLTFFGFAVKVGLAPLNAWLPHAHPAAPANVSAILSGMILNLGIYGILRIDFQFVPIKTIASGMLLLIIGIISALVGILYATTEHDLKAVLAHSSIESMGIITLGLGAGVVFAACGKAMLSGIAFLAAFYHLANHSIYKALLFLGAGVVDDRTGTRDLDKLGGLLRRMPWTGSLFLIGALAISAVPPFNGFVSEWIMLQALLRSAEFSSTALRLAFALCGAVLALTAALAVTCFVKVFAMGFLGIPRSEGAAKASEAPLSAIAPMTFLAVLCLLLGILPTYVVPALNHQLQPLVYVNTADSLVPPFFTANAANQQLPPAFVKDFHDLGAQSGRRLLPGRGLVILLRGSEQNPVIFAMSPSYSLPALALLLFLTWLIVRRLSRNRVLVRRELWAGGIPRLFAQMTYTATGFSNPVRVVFQAVFRPNIAEDTRQTVAVHFRTAIRRRRDETHIVDRMFLRPVGQGVIGLAALLAGMHHGRLNTYVVYVLGFLLLVLLLYRAT